VGFVFLRPQMRTSKSFDAAVGFRLRLHPTYHTSKCR
jgi:hypothetical protein